MIMATKTRVLIENSAAMFVAAATVFYVLNLGQPDTTIVIALLFVINIVGVWTGTHLTWRKKETS